jgi:hypothetical protein
VVCDLVGWFVPGLNRRRGASSRWQVDARVLPLLRGIKLAQTST